MLAQTGTQRGKLLYIARQPGCQCKVLFGRLGDPFLKITVVQ